MDLNLGIRKIDYIMDHLLKIELKFFINYCIDKKLKYIKMKHYNYQKIICLLLL